MKKKKDISFLQALSLLTTMGIVMISNLLVGLFVGRFLDQYLHTQPWLTLIFIFIGFGAGLHAVYKLISR